MGDPSELDLLRNLLSAMDLADHVHRHFPLPNRMDRDEEARLARTAHEVAEDEVRQARFEFVHRMRIENRPLGEWGDGSGLNLDPYDSQDHAQATLNAKAEAEGKPLRAPYRGTWLFSKRRPA